jgi:peptidoglycan/LPS O-acetylase OafA/YrhL
MHYRREIDGLRALAILPVIFFHAGFQSFSGGFIGVDVFFVISGYLITTIILAELEKGNFSIINFYERRARRILPVLFFIMTVCIPFSWILLPPFDLISFSKSLTSVSLFLSNFFFLKDGGYFETAAELKPLLHTWSLAVEEQYYILFPILLRISWKAGKRWALNLTILLVIISLAAAQLGSLYKPLPNFFLLPTRAWELGTGSLIAFYFSKNIATLDCFYRQLLSCLGITLITISIFLFNKDTPSPSIYTLAPVTGTALILLFSLPDTFTGKLLGSRLISPIGLISYSAYLWHQPILAFSRYYFSSISSTQTFNLIIATFFLSALSWRYIENPFRNKNIVTKRTIFTFTLIYTLSLISFGYSTSKLFKSSSSYGIEEKMAKSLSSATAVYASNMDERQFIKFRIQFENLSPNTIVLGSSRIMQIGEHNYNNKIINLGVSGASIEDDIAIADIATKKFKPSTIFIGLDPWLFNSQSGQERWKSLSNEYFSALGTLNTDSVSKNNQNIVNESFLRKIGKKIYSSINNQKFDASNDTPESRDKIRRDGSHVYNITYAMKTQTEIDAGFDDLLNYGMSVFKYSSESEEIFGSFIDTYSKSYNIILILSPYHPNLYQRFKNERPIYLEIESQFREFSKKHHVQIIGSYNPDEIGCIAADFYDGMHPKDICMEKVIGELKN